MRSYLLILAIGTSLLVSAAPQNFLELANNSEARMKIHVNNRVLACPNNKPITVLDLMQKLDILFLQRFPQYSDLVPARFQFYQALWRQILDEMINNELILADAAAREIKLEDGDIRQELEEMFGPDVVFSLDALGMTYDEAWEMIKQDMIVDRMRAYMVSMRAQTLVKPSMVAEEYLNFSAEHAGKDEWHYRVLSLRHQDREKALAAAKVAEELIQAAEVVDLSLVAAELEKKKQQSLIDTRVSISVSELEKRPLESLAESHKEALSKLVKGKWSEPVGQLSRVDRCMVYRIFHLVDYIEQPPPSFKEVERELQGRLIQTEAIEQQKKYIARLRDQYGITEDYLAQMLPSDFYPFALR